MVTFANMDKFASDAAASRIEQRANVRPQPLKQLRLGDCVFVRGQYWTLVDYIFKDQSVILRHGNQCEVVDIWELA